MVVFLLRNRLWNCWLSPRASYQYRHPFEWRRLFPAIRFTVLPSTATWLSVLLQPEMERRHVRVILQLGRSFSDAKAPQELHAPEKVAILRRHLLDRVPVSDLCDEYQLQPTLFYAWQKLFFENGASAFERKNGSADQALRRPSRRCGQAPAQERGRRGIDGRTYPTKKSWGTLTKAWVKRRAPAAPVHRLTATGRNVLNSSPSTHPLAGHRARVSSTIGGSVTAWPTNTTPWSRTTGGSKTGRNKRSSPSTPTISSTAIGGLPS